MHPGDLLRLHNAVTVTVPVRGIRLHPEASAHRQPAQQVVTVPVRGIRLHLIDAAAVRSIAVTVPVRGIRLHLCALLAMPARHLGYCPREGYKVASELA